MKGDAKMSSEREDNEALADRLRGKAMNDAREAGKQLTQHVGKVQTVNEISGPTATPKLTQEQSASVRERHVAEKSQQQNQIGSPAAGQAEQKPAQEKSAVASKDKSLAEIAQSMRQAGVSGRASNDVGRPKETPAVEHKQSRGRGR
jgi:hypothetical protein